jgi:phosphoribosylpyrophosphate synthetase
MIRHCLFHRATYFLIGLSKEVLYINNLKNSVMRKQILFYCPSQEILAQEVLDLNFHVIKGAINWNHFDDGFPDLQVLVPERLYDNDVLFLADFSDATEIFRQLAVIYALPSFGINSLKVFLPFFSTGTMDRVTEEGQIVTAKTLARMLSVIPAAACPTQIIILDIHALQEQFYFSDQVRIKCISGIPFFQIGRASCRERV